jgi:hypothetical protein
MLVFKDKIVDVFQIMEMNDSGPSSKPSDGLPATIIIILGLPRLIYVVLGVLHINVSFSALDQCPIVGENSDRRCIRHLFSEAFRSRSDDKGCSGDSGVRDITNVLVYTYHSATRSSI